MSPYTSDLYNDAVVETFSDGKFVVIMESWEEDGGHNGVFGQRFDSDGNEEGEYF